MALPTLTRTLDDDFVNTWYEIRADVIDNVNEAHVLNLALREFGCYTPQVGGEYITRTIGYGQKSIQAFDRGTVLSQKVEKLDTLAMWDWRYFLVDVNRTLIDDAKNAGPSKTKDYLTRRLGAARDALVTDSETFLSRWGVYTAAPYLPNGIYDICPGQAAESAPTGGTANDAAASGTYNGGINRTNTYWRNWNTKGSGTAETVASKIGTPTNAPYSLNLVPDMRHFFNLVNANQEAPNFIIMNQLIYEAYEDEVGDRQQIVRTGFNKKAADLGFASLTFKGAPLTYSSMIDELHIFMLNMNHIEVVYDPNVWYDMTEWKTAANQLERVAYVACMETGLITDQPRRHGHMEYAS